jgi:hypothetical protein
MTEGRIDEIDPLPDAAQDGPPMLSVIAMITEPDGTDRSSRLTLPAGSDDAMIVHALREVAMSAAHLRGVPTDVADWAAHHSMRLEEAIILLRDWVTQRIAARRVPGPEECRDLIAALLHAM